MCPKGSMGFGHSDLGFLTTCLLRNTVNSIQNLRAEVTKHFMDNEPYTTSGKICKACGIWFIVQLTFQTNAKLATRASPMLLRLCISALLTMSLPRMISCTRTCRERPQCQIYRWVSHASSCSFITTWFLLVYICVAVCCDARLVFLNLRLDSGVGHGQWACMHCNANGP